MRCNINKLVPKSIIDFKINCNQTWKELINHNFLTYAFTQSQETLTDTNIASWYEFVTQMQFRKNLIKHTLKNQENRITEDNVKLIDFKKPKDRFWKLHHLNENNIKTSDLNRVTLSWYFKIVNSEDRMRKIMILVNAYSMFEICQQNKYIFEKIKNYEYDLYDYEHNKLLESKLNFVSNNLNHTNISKIIKEHKMYDLFVHQAGDIGRIYNAVDANIEFLDKF